MLAFLVSAHFKLSLEKGSSKLLNLCQFCTPMIRQDYNVYLGHLFINVKLKMPRKKQKGYGLYMVNVLQLIELYGSPCKIISKGKFLILWKTLKSP